MPQPTIKTDRINRLIEAIGLKYFLRFSQRVKAESTVKLQEIPSDRVLEVVSENLTLTLVMIAFLIGALSTVPAVLVEIYYQGVWERWYYYGVLSLVTLLFLIIEVGILYWLGIRGAYTLAYLTGYQEDEELALPPEYDVKKMMVRAALEIEDPSIEYLGIDPQKYVSPRWLLVSTLLYKAKIVLTTLVAKLVLKKVAMRYGVRMGFAWVAIPVTALWDAIVMYRVIQDAKLRLFGYHLSRYIAQEIMTQEHLSHYSEGIAEGAIRAISTLMVMAKNYHPNNVLLLIRLNEVFAIEEEKNYDDLPYYLEYLERLPPKDRHLLRMLSGVSAVFDGKMTRAEKQALEQIFGEERERYMAFTKRLKAELLSGHLHQAATLCEEGMITGWNEKV